MKFTKPINREVEIHGNTFIVSMDEAGIGFRLKGKRKTALVNWAAVLEIAEREGEDGSQAKSSHTVGSHPTQLAGEQPAGLASETTEGAGNLSHTATAGEGQSDF